MLAWVALTAAPAQPHANGNAIFGWQILCVTLAACEVLSFCDRTFAHPNLNLKPITSSMDTHAESAEPPKLDLPADVSPVASDHDVHSPTVRAETSTQNSRQGWKWALLLVAGLLALYMVVVPSIEYAVERMTPPKTSRVMEDMTLSEKMRLHSVTGVVMLMFLALGATIGSFLNVVIYRVPRGKRLLWPPSSCASCGTRIQGKDNVPVFGWILLSGRCRTCGAAISMRYPIIEAVVATIFISLYYVELLSGGDNIPVRIPNTYRGVVWILLYTKWDLVGLYVFHCAMLSLLLAVAMMNVDGFRLPRRAAVFLIVVFAALSIAIPALRPVPSPLVPAYLTCVVGLAAGGAVGWIVQTILPIKRHLADIQPANIPSADLVPGSDETTEVEINSISSAEDIHDPTVDSTISRDQLSKYGQPATEPESQADAAFALALLGLTLGPQAVATVAVLLIPFVLAYLVPNLSWLRAKPITLIIFSVAFGHQLLWAQLHRLMNFPG